MPKQNRLILAIAAAVFILIVILEMAAPANIVGAYAFVLPILLVAALRSRPLMLATVVACIAATYLGLMQPTKPGRFQAAVINRTVVAGVLLMVAYIGMTREERKAREEAARAALAQQTESLLRANSLLVDAKDQLNRSERLAAVGQLVASVAHEVGTPLHSIAWHVQALAEEPGVTPEMKKRITVIDEQLNRVVRIIQDLLSSTRQRKPDPCWMSVEQVITPATALMEPAFHAKAVTLTTELAIGLPWVWADAEKLHQVLVNLLTNALVATAQRGAVDVHVGGRAATPEELETGRRLAPDMSPMVVTVAVRDTGIGMPQADVQKAFQPFFTTKEVGKGTGLGLFLSRETVQAHGGTLSLASEQGRGTTVTITLPGKMTAPEAVA
ncbi:MAG TPA: ATP-binding protein [Nitrospira sp.]|nr:ATP-binding protein [Nitrospira sp.]